MKELVVLSGKGGTGKTSIVGSFAALADNKIMSDCDVDAADLHLILNPEVLEENEFWSGQVAEINKFKCTHCGLCSDLCRFNAISRRKVDAFLCEGCGFCYQVCPEDAITMRQNMSGKWFISKTQYGMLVHAKLGIAQENSGKLVSVVRQKAREIAQEQSLEYILTDGPPGIGCPVISSISGVSKALIVTEPTISGLHDMDRILGLCEHFNIEALVCVNKYDINEENTGKITQYCEDRKISIAGHIPYDDIITEAMVHGKPVVTYKQNDTSKAIENLWDKLLERMTG
ncbi:MAG: ATP-binding protein [Dehalococcoidales bacterium]|nr:ATP-binding protein [Dehalococcoidales bacterium]